MGAVDEAQVTLGVCRSLVTQFGSIENFDQDSGNVGQHSVVYLPQNTITLLNRLKNDLTHLQQDLLVAGGILSSSPGDTIPEGMPLINEERIDFLTETFKWWRKQNHIEPRFFIAGDTRIGAEFDRARTVIRRAERETVRLIRERGVQQQIPVSRYLNQLSDLCFVLARWSDSACRKDLET